MIIRSALLLLALLPLAAGASVPPAEVNFVHLAPFDPEPQATLVSAWAGKEQVDDLVGYGQSSQYVVLSDRYAGREPFKVMSPAESGMALLGSNLGLESGHTYTVAVVGDGANFPLEFVVLKDEPPRAANGLSLVRIVHVAPFSSSLDATALSVRNGAGEVVAGLGELRYRGDSGFLSMLPGTYQLEFADPESGVKRIQPRPVTLNSGDVITLFVTGDAANQPLGVVRVDQSGAATMLAAPLPSVGAFSVAGGWLGYLAIAAVLACFVGVKKHRKQPLAERPKRREISVRHV